MMIGERMSSHELCETAECNGIPNICGYCERKRIYAAERAERKRIIARLNSLIERYAAEGINAFSLQAFLNELEGK